MAAHDHGHEHTEGGTLWDEFIHLATDPAHLLFELSFSIVFDIIIVSVIWGVIIKKVIIPKIRRDVHREIDAEHGITHDEDAAGHAEREGNS